MPTKRDKAAAIIQGILSETLGVGRDGEINGIGTASYKIVDATTGREGMPKWPDQVTSSKTECAHTTCPDQVACRKGCIHQRPITFDDAPTAH